MKTIATILLVLLMMSTPLQAKVTTELNQLYQKFGKGIEEAYEGASHKLEIHPFEGGIEGIFPVYGALLMTEATSFRWRGKEIQGKSPVLVFAQKLLPVKSKDKKILLSAKELDMKPGKEYNWYLGRLEDGKKIGQSRVFRFRILSNQEAGLLKKELAKLDLLPYTPEGKQFLKAQTYYNYQMYHDIVALLEPLYKMHPTEGLRKFLFLGYVRLGRHHEAKKIAPKNRY